MLITACPIQTDRAEYDVNTLLNRLQQWFATAGVNLGTTVALWLSGIYICFSAENEKNPNNLQTTKKTDNQSLLSRRQT